MLKVGLTGGIGSGKSTVADLFAKHGVTIIDADIIARKLTEKHSACYQKIAAHFGNKILAEDGEINRQLLREIIFNNSEQRHWLEQLLHPLIRKQLLVAMQQAGEAYCITVVPLLIENDFCAEFDRILVVDTDPEQQQQRVMSRDGSDKTVVQQIMQRQVTRKKRLSLADDVIDNNGSLYELSIQVEQLHQKYTRK